MPRASSPTTASPITWRGCAAAPGLITVEMASPEKCGRHRRHEVGIYDDRFLPGLTRLVARNPCRRRQGLDPARPWRRPHPHRHLRRDADRAVGDPASGLRDHVETIIPQEMTQGAHRRDHRRLCRRGGARRAGRLRLRRDPCRARLSDLAISHAVREPPHRRYGGSLENRARFGLDVLRAVKAAVPGIPRDLPALGRGLFSRRAAVQRRPAGRALGRARRAPTRCTSRPGIIARCPRRSCMIPPMAYPDATFLDYAAD